MKKWLIALLSVASMAFILGGCTKPGGASKTPLEVIQQKYELIGEANVISQDIEIVSGNLVQYTSEKSYTKTEDGYIVEGVTRRLNDITADEAYTETTVNETLSSVAEFDALLTLDEEYFHSSEITETSLTAEVYDASVKSILGITEDLPAPVRSMTLEITADETHVTGIAISYESGTSIVNISLRFAY